MTYPLYGNGSIDGGDFWHNLLKDNALLILFRGSKSMGRLLRFFLVLNMWLGFNYGVIINLYHSLPKIDRPLFIFVYITLIVIPPAVFYAYLTFIYEKDYIHAYELKKFINKKLHLNRVLLNALMTGAGIIYRCGGNLSPEFNDRLNLLKSQIHIGHDQEIF